MKNYAIIVITLLSFSIDARSIFSSHGKKIAQSGLNNAPVLPNIYSPQAEPSINRPSKERGQAIRQLKENNDKVYSKTKSFRFRRIAMPSADASNEIDFWGRQMSEHVFFTYLGLEDPFLKQRALDSYYKFEEFRNEFNKNPLNIKVMNKILPLLKKQREFQITLLHKMNKAHWIGWVFPDFVNHITQELDYFVDKLNGIGYTAADEIAFWNHISSDHAGITAHLLDPSEKEYVKKAQTHSEKLEDMSKNEKEFMINLSIKATKELDIFTTHIANNRGAIKSIIHPALFDHVSREGDRAIETFKSLQLDNVANDFRQNHEANLQDLNENEA